MTALGYLRQELGIDGDFMAEYRKLSKDEKDSLRAYAEQEMGTLGIEIEKAQ